VLIMTSYASLRSAVDSMKMGAVDYIAKPFDHDEMLQAVARILRDRQSAPAAGEALAGKPPMARQIVCRQQQWRDRHHRLLPADAGPVQQDPQSRADRLQCADPGRVRHR
jgi:DNA-binding NtrC family response regulator